jgi:hypothetical protein
MIVVIDMQPGSASRSRSNRIFFPWTVALVGDPDLNYVKLIRPTLESVIASFETVASIAKLSDLQVSRGHVQAVIVIADGFSGLPKVYRALRSFRHKHPEVAMLVFSSRVVSDDYTTDRGGIFDVVLRLPITTGQMIGAMIQADINNRHWCAKNE